MDRPEGVAGVLCQLLFVRRDDEEILLDLIPLEPLPADGLEVLPPGTPLTLGLAEPPDPLEGERLYSVFERWTSRSSTCRLWAMEVDRGQRLMISGDGRHVVVDLDGESGVCDEVRGPGDDRV